MASSQGTVSLDNLGQAAYTGKLAEIVDALNNDKQLAHMADTVGNVFYLFFWHYLSILFLMFLTEAAQYECSYRRTAHHATGSVQRIL